ncbi:Ribonuclease VapC51 [Paraconexibacter sp. AEG42_29]|uniref:Ribonuclease VapC n=1 Tax=Paraconexibacter sp. AEG42_29 TaxID=2997339 RepID=A0AAU7AY22_9ACTN
MNDRPFGSGIPLVVDTSAWARHRDPGVAERWQATLRAGLVASCPVAALEILASARDEAGHAALDGALGALPQAPVTATVCTAALGASRQLRGSRRLPAADYLIAAAAAERGFGVLHLDSHYDTLATVLGFLSVRLDRD